jgi:hypothetical protein
LSYLLHFGFFRLSISVTKFYHRYRFPQGKSPVIIEC